MSTIETNPSKLSIDLPLVTDLIKTQFPDRSTLPIKRLGSTGTENAVYRLGGEALIRLPTTDGAARQVNKEQDWLPKFAEADLPLAIPKVIAAGTPSEGYPHNWSIYNWLKGKPATTERITDIRHAAEVLGEFVVRFQAIDPTGGPVPGEHNFFRGVPLAERDELTQKALRELHPRLSAEGFDTEKISTIWDAAVTTPEWKGEPRWIHGDLADSNMLAKRRRKKNDHRELSAVIDFGGMAVGDPACDLLVGWDVVASERDRFFDIVRPDSDTLQRGRGWALSTALVSLMRFGDSPAISTPAKHKLRQAMAGV